jgi:hypothetical protein
VLNAGKITVSPAAGVDGDASGGVVESATVSDQFAASWTSLLTAPLQYNVAIYFFS